MSNSIFTNLTIQEETKNAFIAALKTLTEDLVGLSSIIGHIIYAKDVEIYGQALDIMITPDSECYSCKYIDSCMKYNKLKTMTKDRNNDIFNIAILKCSVKNYQRTNQII